MRNYLQMLQEGIAKLKVISDVKAIENLLAVFEDLLDFKIG